MNAWRELAGAKATLALSEGEVPEIAALEATLAPLRARFAANPEISRLLSHVPQTDASRASRLQEWASSRQCLILALNEALDLGAPPEQTRASLSHCDDRSIAVVAFGAASVAGVGADIERADRPMSEAATARVRTSDEAAQGLSGLEAWVIKEACYKADPLNSGRNSDMVVMDYRLTRENVRDPNAPIQATSLRSGSRLRALCRRDGEHLLGLAVALR